MSHGSLLLLNTALQRIQLRSQLGSVSVWCLVTMTWERERERETEDGGGEVCKAQERTNLTTT